MAHIDKLKSRKLIISMSGLIIVLYNMFFPDVLNHIYVGYYVLIVGIYVLCECLVDIARYKNGGI